MSNQESILKKIDELKKRFVLHEDVERIAQWEAEVKRAMIVANLAGNEGVKTILKKLRDDLRDMNFLLETARSEKLSDRQRDNLLDRKELYEWFINLFKVAKKNVEAAEEDADHNLDEEEE